MAIVPAVTAPCWTAKLMPEGDELHFPTRVEALTTAAGQTGWVVNRLPVLCYFAECDRCRYREGEAETMFGHHLPAFEPYHVLMDLGDLARVGTELLCTECAPAELVAFPGTPEPMAGAR